MNFTSRLIACFAGMEYLFGGGTIVAKKITVSKNGSYIVSGLCAGCGPNHWRQ